MSVRRTCRCGHPDFEHLGSQRCDEGSRRCGCGLFRECLHESVREWRISFPEPKTRLVCVVCCQVQDGAVV